MPTIYVREGTPLPKRIPQDVYETDPDLASAVFHYLDLNYKLPPITHAHVLDPGAGHGVWGQEVCRWMGPVHITGVELRQLPRPLNYTKWVGGTNFLSWRTKQQFSLIIGNPPFKLAERFIRKSIRLLNARGLLCFLLPTHFIHGQDRGRNLFAKHRPDRVISLMQRPEFTGPNGESLGKGTPNTMILMVWRKLSSSSEYPLFDWLDWQEE